MTERLSPDGAGSVKYSAPPGPRTCLGVVAGRRISAYMGVVPSHPAPRCSRRRRSAAGLGCSRSHAQQHWQSGFEQTAPGIPVAS